ncbi:MAG: pilus assembly protein TadG-related protein, partial [Actinomycetota bacterium]
MRVTRTLLFDESGASLALVGLTMFALLGMAMLAIDVGGIVVARRQMVRAADAAALAAAQSCATNKSDEAEAKADEFAVANHNAADGGIVDVEGVCGASGSGSVTVRYVAPQELFFAPALGFDRDTDVPGRATALWAPSDEAFSLPLEITLGSSENGFPCIDFGNPGEVCNYYFDNSADHDLQDSSNWGWINLATWPQSEEENAERAADPDSVQCPNAGNDLRDWLEAWIVDDGAEKFKGNLYPGGTYVCVNDGHSLAGVYGSLLEQLEGKDVFFPVNDPNQMYQGHPGLYSIIGFAPMHIDKVLRGNEATGQPAASGSCVIEDVVFEDRGDTFNVGPDLATCLGDTSPDSLTGPVLLRTGDDDDDDDDDGRGGGRSGIVPSAHYTYNPTTGVITWRHPREET